MTPQWLTRSLCRFKDGNEISFNEEKKGRDTLLVGIASGMRGSFGTKCNKNFYVLPLWIASPKVQNFFEHLELNLSFFFIHL